MVVRASFRFNALTLQRIQRRNDVTWRSHFSWREPIDLPRSIRLPRVPKPVMQTIGTALPKFHFIRLKSITAPVRRQWNWLVAVALSHFRHARIEHTPAIDHLALTRRPCAQLASDRARMKISLRLFTRGLFHFSTDTNCRSSSIQ